MDLKALFLQQVLPVVATLAGSALVWLVSQGAAYLRAKAKDTAWASSVDKVADLAAHTVAHLEAVERPALVSALQAGGGKLDAMAGKQLKDLAVNAMLESMPSDLKTQLGDALHLMISGAIERAVSNLKVPGVKS